MNVSPVYIPAKPVLPQADVSVKIIFFYNYIYNNYYFNNTIINIIACGYDVENRHPPRHCTCKPGFYENRPTEECLPCVKPCVKCSSAIQCSEWECDNPLSNMYYNTTQRKCVFCVYPCLTCTTATHCTQCGYDLENRNPTPYCSCKSGFFERGQECLKCVRPCLTCSSETQCVTLVCNRHNGLVTKEYIEGKICKRCPYPCEECE